MKSITKKIEDIKERSKYLEKKGKDIQHKKDNKGRIVYKECNKCHHHKQFINMRINSTYTYKCCKCGNKNQ